MAKLNDFRFFQIHYIDRNGREQRKVFRHAGPLEFARKRARAFCSTCNLQFIRVTTFEIDLDVIEANHGNRMDVPEF